ncbi:MAG: hypothetical protein V4551_16720 [Pseudomonadota bacterium]|jgi:hypothetical protein
MMMEYRTTETLLEALVNALGEATGAAAHIVHEPQPLQNTAHPDAVIELGLEGKLYRFVVDAKRSLYPRDAREAIWKIRSYLADWGRTDRQFIPVLVADSISPGARELLREERVGHFDTSGSLFISAKGLYIRIDRPSSPKQQRAITNIFSGRRAQALHAVWTFGSNWFGVHQVADRAGVSPATASETLISIERREWVEVRGSGPSKERRLIDRRALLDAWADHQATVKPTANKHFYLRATALSDLQKLIDHTCDREGIPYEFTGITAGQIHAPYLSTVSQVFCRLPATHRAKAVLEAIDARPVREGWNLAVQESRSDDDFRFRQRQNDLWVADPLQTYLDLLQSGGRAKELAQHMRAEKLEAL